MAKKKKGLADMMAKKRSSTEVKINPFEVKLNRQKHDVLGRKVSKRDKGMPGVSRSRSIKKRQETLLVEWKKRGKANKFLDKRFAEGDAAMSAEDKMLARFALEKQKIHEKSSKFNLNEDEELTHYGQSLSEIEKFKDPVDLSDDDDEDDEGRINAKITGEEHFGGFMTKVEEGQGHEIPRKSYKERMEEVIAQSKKAKYERQSEKEKSIEMTQKVDEEWKEIHMLLAGSKKSKETTQEKKQMDDFDITVRELQFEAKGQATDRLKTEEELAQEEKERLDKLEADRLRRMKGMLDEDIPQVQHRSADDLDDGYTLSQVHKEKNRNVRFHVSYKDGKLLTLETENVEESCDEDEEDSDDNSGEPSGSDGEENAPGEDEEGDDGMDEEDDKGVDEDEDDDDDSDEDDEYSDIGLDQSEEEAEDDDEEESGEDKEETVIKEKTSKTLKGILKQDPVKVIEDLRKRKLVMEAARKELPYTFETPKTYEDLVALLASHSVNDQLVILERLRKCTHPSLAEGNKEKLQRIFTLLLQYYGDLAEENPPQFELIDRLTLPVYELTQQFPVTAAIVIKELIAERHDRFKALAERRGGRGIFPAFDTLLYFKLISVLFPTSDLRHKVVTPAMLFMGQILSKSPVMNLRDVSVGLFLCNLFLEYVSASKRLVPEVLNFLHGVLFLAADKDTDKIEDVFPPFKPVGKNINLLEVSKRSRKVTVTKLKISKAICCTDLRTLDNDDFKIHIIHTCLTLIKEFSALYQTVPSWQDSFSPFLHMLNKLPVKSYPATTKDLHSQLVDSLSQEKPRPFLTKAQKKPSSIRLMEPKFDEVYDGKKKHGGNRDFKEKQALIHKHKKELKGAMREIRRDNQFLAQQQLKERMERDAERKRKVKEIHQMLSTQEGEFKAIQRKKKRK